MTREKGRPLVITQNGKPAAVVISPEEFDNMEYTRPFMNSVTRGLKDVDAGNSFTTEEVKKELNKKRSAR